MCTRTWTNVPCFLRFMLRNSSLQERVAEALDRSRRQPPATMVLGPYSFRIEYIEIKSCLDVNHLVHNDNITLSLIISHSFTYSMFFYVLYDLFHRTTWRQSIHVSISQIWVRLHWAAESVTESLRVVCSTLQIRRAPWTSAISRDCASAHQNIEAMSAMYALTHYHWIF